MALNENTRALQEEREAMFQSDKPRPSFLEQVKKLPSQFEGAPSRIQIEDYEDYLPTGGIDPISGDIDEARAQGQSGMQLIGNAIGQSVTELTLGTLEGMGYLADAPSTVYNGLQGKEEEFDNWFSEIMRGAKEHIHEEWFPIYQTRAAQEGKFLDRTSLAGNTKNLMTTLSLMIPATGVARGIGALGKLARVNPGLTKMAQAIGAGIASRASEATMEAQQYMTGDQEKLYQQAMEKYRPQLETELDSLPIAMPYNPESPINYTAEDRARDEKNIFDKYNKLAKDESIQLAAEGANKVFQGNAALAVLDAFQYSHLFKALGGVSKGVKGGKILDLGYQMGSEAAEEGYQAALGMEAFYASKEGNKFLGPGFSERMGDYLKEGEMHTSMFWGALGGGVFQAFGPAVRKGIEVGENVNATLKTSRLRKDLVAKSKLEDDVITSVVMQNARRNNLDKMAGSINTFAQGVTEEVLSENNMTQEEFDANLEKINKTIEFVKTRKEELDNNNLFEGKEEAKWNYINAELDVNNTSNTIKEAKKHINDIYSELEQGGQLTSELKTLKDLELRLKAAKNTKANLKKIPSLKKDRKLREKVSNALDKNIRLLETQLKPLKESYQNNNPDVNLNDVLTTTKDEELSNYHDRVKELEVVNTNVNKPKLNSFKFAEKVNEIQEEAKKEREEAQKKATKETVETAKTKEDVEAAVASAPEEVSDDIVNEVEKKAAKEAEGAPWQMNERYNGRPNLFTHEQAELEEAVNVENLPDHIKNDFNAVIFAKTPEAFVQAINNIQTKAAQKVPGYQGLAHDIGMYYREKHAKTQEAAADNYVQPDNEQPTTQTEATDTNTSDINYESKTDSKKDNSRQANRSTITEFHMKQDKNGNWVILTEDGQPVKYGLGNELGINWDYVNNPENLQTNSEVYFVVDLSNYKPDDSKFDFIDNFRILIAQNDANGNRQIVGMLPSKYTKDNSNDWKKLQQLRRQIAIQVRNAIKEGQTGILDTGLVSNVTYKGPGKMMTTKAKDNPHTRLKEGEELILGVAVEKNGLTTIEAGENYPEWSGVEVDNKHAGKVFVLVKSANGEILPAMAFTTDISAHPELLKQATDLLVNSNKDNWANNREELRKIVYLDYMYIPSEDVFKMIPSGEKFTKAQVAEMLANKVVQISKNEVGRGDYNQKVSEEGRIKTDLAVNHVVNANFEFDLGGIRSREDSDNNKDTNVDLPADTDTTVLPEEEVKETVEETKEEPNVPKETKTLGGLKKPTRKNGTKRNIDINLDDLNREATEEFYELWNQAKETAWFKERFGEDLLRIEEGLLNIAKSGGAKAWGQFKEGMAVISSVAKTGTTYHEAFHVVFHLFLSPKQQQQLLEEGSKKYGIPMSDPIGIEEKVADEFMEYVMTEEGTKPSLTKRIANFFKRIYYAMKEQLTSDLTINQVFYKAQHGQYKNEPFSRDVSKFDIVRNRPYDNIYEQNRRTISLADEMRQSFDAILKDMPEFESVSRKDILDVMTDTNELGTVYKGIEILAVDAFNAIEEKFAKIKADGNLSSEKEAAITKMLENFITVNEDGSIVFGDLGRKAVQQFANTEGIRVKLSTKEVQSFTDSAQEEGTNLVEFNEEETVLEGWQVKAEEMSGKESLSKDVRRELSYIPKLDEQGNPVKDDLGFIVYQDFNELYATLKRDFADVLTADELLDRLEVIMETKPYLAKLFDKIIENKLFKTRMFVDFAKAHVEYKMVVESRVYDKDGTYSTTYKLITANRNNVKNLIIDDIKSAGTSNVTNTLIDKDGNVIAASAADFFKYTDDIAKFLKRNKFNAKVAESIANRLNSIGIDITGEEIQLIHKLKTNKVNFNTFMRAVRSVGASFNNGKNPFATETLEASSVDSLAKNIAAVRFELLESSFKNTENKTIYSHQVPTFLSKFIQKFKRDTWEQTVNWYTDTNFYRNSPWLKSLREKGVRDNFEFLELDGFKPAGKDKGTRYVDMSTKEYENVTVNMFFNNGAANYAYYRVPVVSDAPKMLFIKFEKYDNNQVVDKLYNVYQQEWARIEQVKTREAARKEFEKENPGKELPKELQPIKNFDDAANIEKSKRFLLLPFLNSGNARKMVGAKNEKGIKDAIREWLNQEAAKDFERLQQQGVFGELADVDSRINAQGNKYGGNQEQFHRHYFYNSVLANTQMSSMMSGDPAFYAADDKKKKSIYSRTVDFQKRNKQIVSPGLMLDTDAVYTTEDGTEVKVNKEYNTIYIKDVETSSEHVEEIYDALKEAGLSDSAASEISDAYNFVNVTDAQAYITLPRYREIMIGLGRWTKRHQDIYPKLLDGTASGKDLKFVMQPLKPFYFGHTKVGDMVVPVQNKNSEYLLLPQLVNKSPQLKKIYDHMINNNISSANFDSAVKAGLFGAKSPEEIEQATIHTLNNSDFALQQETPEHYLDNRNLFGTQIRKLIIADIDSDATFNVDGKDFTRDELIDLYQSIIVKDLQESYSNVEGRFVDINSVQELLLEEIRDRDMGEEAEKAVEIVQRKNPITGQIEDTFNLPLYHPLHSKRIESLLNSVFKNNVTKQKIKGGAFIQLSAFGFSKDLNLVIKDGRLVEAECMLPWWSKKYFEPLLDENGQLDIKKVPNDLLEMIGYRIPTEDKYSMLPLKVKGFLPSSAGGAVMLPMEITTISGSDFDVDKLYIMMPAFEKAYDKQMIKDINRTIEKRMHQAVKDGKFKAMVPKESFDIERILNYVENGVTLDNNDKIVYQLYRQGLDSGMFQEPSLDKEGIRKVKYDYNGTTEQSKQARDNAKIDIMRAVLTHPDTFEKFIKPGGFDTLKNRATKVLELEGKADEMLPMILPSTQTELFNRNMAGRALKGIFANHNAHHAVLQHTDVALTQPVELGGEVLTSLNDVKNSNGQFISRNVAEFLAAAVDNAKEPVSSFLNINTYTANTSALLARLGLPIDVVGTFLAQPILKQLSERYFMYGGTMQAENTAVKEIRAAYDKADVEKTISDNPTLKELEDILEGKGNEADQLYILDKFLSIKDQADTLAKLVRANRADTKGAGPVLASNERLMNARKEILKTETLSGVEDLLEGNNYKLIEAFDKYGVRKPTALLSEYFPWMRAAYRNVKNNILELLPTRDLTEQQIEQINYELLGYAASEFEFFDGSDRDSVINNLHKKFKKLKESNPDLFNTNMLLKRLRIEDASNPKDPSRITFRNTGSLNHLERTQIQESWQELLETPGEIGIFAKELVKYTFYTAGFKLTPKSFSHLVPVEFYAHLTDSVGQTFNDFLTKQMDAAKTDTDMYLGFINDFFRNNHDTTAYVPKVNRKFTNITGGMGMIKGKPAYFKVNALEPTTTNDFVLKIGKENAEFSPYVSFKHRGSLYLYKLVNQSIDSFTGIYILEEKLGIPNEALEYTREFKTDSVIAGNNPYVGFTQADARAKAMELLGVKPRQQTVQQKATQESIKGVTPKTTETSEQDTKNMSKTKQDIKEALEANPELAKELDETMGIRIDNIEALTEKEAGTILKKICKG